MLLEPSAGRLARSVPRGGDLTATPPEDNLHRHHIQPTSLDGTNSLRNLVIVHIQSHYHIHYGSNLEYWINELKNFKENPPVNNMLKNLTFTEPAD